MKKKILWICIPLIILVIGYANLTKKEDIKEKNVVATFYPVYISLINLTDGVNIQTYNLTQNVTTCLHDYSLTTNQMASLEDASLVVMNGLHMEPFVDKINSTKIDTSTNTNLLYNEYGEANSHIYLDIDNYIVQTENICNGLINLDVDNMDKYNNNKTIFVDKLKDLKAEYNKEKENIKGTKVVIYNGAIEYITNMLDLNVIANLEFDHENGLDSNKVIDIIQKIKNEEVKYILVPNDYDRESINAIIDEETVQVIELDLFIYGENSKEAYINTMTKNLQNLKEIEK